MNEKRLVNLEQTLRREMPICTAMEIAVLSWDCPINKESSIRGGSRLSKRGQLAMSMPLTPNRNHQDSAFAGSLNALCTIVGWGTLFMLLEQQNLFGNIVIRRSNIRYRRPVRTSQVVAQGLPLLAEEVDYFYELLQSKGKSKLNVDVEIADAQGPLVTFQGSYVVQK
ncbi:MAG: YiiD C-terminal domain-containing protein [Pirellulales bacterium]